MKIILIILMFFVISGLFIISNNNLAMYKQENIVNFVDRYISWLDHISSNTQKITGEIIKLDWIPQKYYDSEIK